MTDLPHPLQQICVFCGSQGGARGEYLAAARQLGATAGGRVTGVIPEHLMRPEVAHQNLTERVVVDTMHTRKRIMAERADAFVVLPGGYGTFEEMFEMVTWLQLRLHAKPVGVVNVEGYFDHLLRFLRHAADEGFIRPAHWDLLIVESNPLLLLERLRRHVPAVSRHVTLGHLDRG